MKHFCRRVFITLAFLAIGACGDGVPPDPGSDGQMTLAGVDINSDGVRDDLERAIALVFPIDNSERRASRHATTVLQEQILSTSTDELEPLLQRSLNAARCLSYIGGDELYDRHQIIVALALNTRERYLAWAGFQYRASGSVWEVAPVVTADACENGVL